LKNIIKSRVKSHLFAPASSIPIPTPRYNEGDEHLSRPRNAETVKYKSSQGRGGSTMTHVFSFLYFFPHSHPHIYTLVCLQPTASALGMNTVAGSTTTGFVIHAHALKPFGGRNSVQGVAGGRRKSSPVLLHSIAPAPHHNNRVDCVWTL